MKSVGLKCKCGLKMKCGSTVAYCPICGTMKSLKVIRLERIKKAAQKVVRRSMAKNYSGAKVDDAIMELRQVLRAK